MKEAKKILRTIKQDLKPTPKERKEELLLINQKKYVFKTNRLNKKKLINNFSTLFIILLIIISLIFYFIKAPKISKKIYTNNIADNNDITNIVIIPNQNIYITNNDSIVYNNETINNSEFLKYQNILPHLSPDLNINCSSIEEIFNARQIYISDVKITHDYIKYIRPINETEEEKYKKPYSENETIIDRNLFQKRNDQYDYYDFCRLALAKKLIDEKEIKYDNKPLISIIIPSYNKNEMLLKSIRSIQNQNFKNIEMIIINDCSTDSSSNLFNYLLETDPRIRIFHHMTNMGCWRSRLDGILYSRGKYIILFDAGDLYEDNNIPFRCI